MVPLFPQANGDDLSALEEHVARRDRVADLFHQVGTRATITLAHGAQNWVVVGPYQDGGLLL
eukprot:6587205-Lingulodinium_polyedra.AAC.1